MTHDEKNESSPEGFGQMMLDQRRALEARFDELSDQIKKLVKPNLRRRKKTCAGCECLTSRWAGGADGYDVMVCGMTEQIVPSTIPDWCPLEEGGR